jgi:hypothetical protein
MMRTNLSQFLWSGAQRVDKRRAVGTLTENESLSVSRKRQAQEFGLTKAKDVISFWQEMAQA